MFVVIYYNDDRKLIQRPLILVPSGSPRALAQNTNAQALPPDPTKSESPWLELDLFVKACPGIHVQPSCQHLLTGYGTNLVVGSWKRVHLPAQWPHLQRRGR